MSGFIPISPLRSVSDALDCLFAYQTAWRHNILAIPPAGPKQGTEEKEERKYEEDNWEARAHKGEQEHGEDETKEREDNRDE
eukprot:5142157-Pyramimonas_sp.AAC.1